MARKTNKSTPNIIVQSLTYDLINSSLTETCLSLIDYSEESGYYPDYDNECNLDYDVIYNEKPEKELTSVGDLNNYIEDTTIKTIAVVKRVLKSLVLKSKKKHEILAFDIIGTDSENNERIIFFIKTIGEDKFTALSLEYNYEIDMQLFMNSIVNLGQFRYYGCGLNGFYMKDVLIEYEFDILKYKDLNFLPRRFLQMIEPVLGNKNKGLYFVIKNSAADPVIITHLSNSDDIETFNNALTKADPQAGLLFSLSYNANK